MCKECPRVRKGQIVQVVRHPDDNGVFGEQKLRLEDCVGRRVVLNHLEGRIGRVVDAHPQKHDVVVDFSGLGGLACVARDHDGEHDEDCYFATVRRHCVVGLSLLDRLAYEVVADACEKEEVVADADEREEVVADADEEEVRY